MDFLQIIFLFASFAEIMDKEKPSLISNMNKVLGVINLFTNSMYLLKDISDVYLQGYFFVFKKQDKF